MGSADLQRYKRLFFGKQRELSSSQDETQSPVPAAKGLQGDLIDQANANAEAELQIRLHQTNSRLFKAIEEALARTRRRTYGVCCTCSQPILGASYN